MHLAATVYPAQPRFPLRTGLRGFGRYCAGAGGAGALVEGISGGGGGVCFSLQPTSTKLPTRLNNAITMNVFFIAPNVCTKIGKRTRENLCTQNQLRRQFTGLLDQVKILAQVTETELGQAALLLPEQFARPA